MTDDGDAAGSGGVGPDLISALPDHLLLTILLRIPTIEAIHTCLLSPRWRMLWTHLPELKFYDNDARIQRLHFSNFVDGALRHSNAENISRLEFSITDEANIDPTRFAAWLGITAERVTGRFVFSIQSVRNDYVDKRMVLELPCFPKAERVFLVLTKGAELRILRPGVGTFASLTGLDLCTFSVRDGGAVLSDTLPSSCPLLKMLRIVDVWGLHELRIRSNSLMEVQLLHLTDLERLDVVAAILYRLRAGYCFLSKIDQGHTALLVDAPILHEVTWFGPCPQERQFGDMRHLLKLTVSAFKPGVMMNKDTRILESFSKVDILQFYLSTPFNVTGHLRHIEQMRFPYHFELELSVARNGHTLGASIIPLLKRCDYTRELTCNLVNNDTRSWSQCLPECVCGDPINWWDDENICLDSLQELVFTNLLGTNDEYLFLYFIFRHAPSLRSVKVKFVERSESDQQIFDDICQYSPVWMLCIMVREYSMMRQRCMHAYKSSSINWDVYVGVGTNALLECYEC